MDLGLTGKRALVTGAATGIGRSTVLALAQEGVTVAALDIDESALKQLVADAPEGSVLTVKADLATGPGCSAAVEEGLRLLGGLDILVNNVGAGAVREFDDITDDDWHATMELNFMSYVRVTRACLPTLRETEG
ncbi:MAG: short-chain dehydrogenase, partial [Marmoricola sp.]|nr:short-chain dehydrogenase [Marmoricola sp.]